ncbi:uncharacterized protein [Miscanthus floridulus]|uniref:uncharacterized protein n=1 Tax=Miscanthus floridulus TaxID=154761 RepID=UPI00345A1E3D
MRLDLASHLPGATTIRRPCLVTASPSTVSSCWRIQCVFTGCIAVVDAAGTSSAGQPLTSTPSTLLLTQGGEELVQLSRVEWLSELISLWENFSGAYGAKLKSLFQDQDVLFGPHEVLFTAIAEANLKRKEDELARTEVVLTYENAHRAMMESALNAKVLEAEKVRDSSL